MPRNKKMVTRRSFLKKSAFTLGALTAAPGVLAKPRKGYAASFPSKPIHVTVPWRPGGGTDIFTRGITPAWEKVLGVPIVVINKPGGNNQVGYEYVYGKEPDGYNMVFGQLPNLNITYLFQKPPYKAESWSWLALVHDDQQIFYCAKQAPWKDLGDLVGDMKRRPGEISVGTTSRGWHYYFPRLLEKKTGLKFGKILPFESGKGASLTREIRGGHQLLATHGSWVSWARRVPTFARGLGTCALKRTPLWPNVPTWNEVLPPEQHVTEDEIYPTVYKGFVFPSAVKEQYPDRWKVLDETWRQTMTTKAFKDAVAKLRATTVIRYKGLDEADREMKKFDKILTEHKDIFARR